MSLILDTGPIVAFLDASDRHHAACFKLLTQADEPLVVPSPTLVEIDYWIRRRVEPRAWHTFVGDIGAGAYLLEHPTHSDLARAAELEQQYADLGLGFVDASIISLCERFGEEKVVTLDHRLFAVVRPVHCPVLRVLPG